MQNTRKRRGDSVLDNLSPDQQRRIIDWLSCDTYQVVLEKIAAPAPEGIGIKIHYTSLRRFWQRHMHVQLRGTRPDAPNQLQALSQQLAKSPSPYPALCREALERYCFHMAMSPHQNADHLLKFSRVLIRLRAQEIAAQKLAHQLGGPSSAPANLRGEHISPSGSDAAIQALLGKLVETEIDHPNGPPESSEKPEKAPKSAEISTLAHDMALLTSQ